MVDASGSWRKTEAIAAPGSVTTEWRGTLTRSERYISVFALVGLNLLLTAIPPLLSILQVGRLPSGIQGMAILAPTTAASASRLGLASLVVIASVYVILRGVRKLDSIVTGFHLALFFILLGCIIAPVATFGHLPFDVLLLNLLTLTALMVLELEVSDLRVIALWGSVLALFSLAFAIFSSEAWMLPSASQAESKALIGNRLLAGPFPHMNNLGMSMAMCLPFVFLLRTRSAKLICAIPMLLCLVLASSRTALIASGVMSLFWLSSRMLGWKRHTARAVLVGVVLVGFCLPWVVSDRNLFTRRANIWIASRAEIEQHPLVGLGFNAYSAGGRLESQIGSALSGHNPFIQYWVVGGVLGVLGVVAWAVASIRAATDLSVVSLAPTVFVLGLWTMSIAELPMRFDGIIGQTWASLCGVAIIASAALRARRADPTSRQTESWTTDGPSLGQHVIRRVE